MDTIHRPVEWAVKLPMVQLEWLKAVFSDKQENELDFLPGCSWRSSPKAGKALCLSYLKLIHIPTCLTEQGH